MRLTYRSYNWIRSSVAFAGAFGLTACGLAFHPALREAPTGTAVPRAVDTIAGRRTSLEMAELTWFTVLFGKAPIDGCGRCYVWFRPRTTVAAR